MNVHGRRVSPPKWASATWPSFRDIPLARRTVFYFPQPPGIVRRGRIEDAYARAPRGASVRRATIMAWAYYLLLLATDVVGLLLAAFTLPGLWLMLAAAAGYAFLTHGQFLSYKTLIALLALASIAEIAEFVLGGAGAKKAGASKWGIVGGLIGAILGGLFLTGVIPIFAPLSTIIGICLGSFAGAFCVELALGRPILKSAHIGYGAAKGRLLGIANKVAVGLLMFLITLWVALPIHGSKPPPAVVPVTTAPATTAAQ